MVEAIPTYHRGDNSHRRLRDLRCRGRLARLGWRSRRLRSRAVAPMTDVQLPAPLTCYARRWRFRRKPFDAQRRSIRRARERGWGQIVRGGLQAWPGRHCLEETQFALQIGTIDKLDQGQEPECVGSNTGG